MSVTLRDISSPRTTRLSVLVSPAEARDITARAEAANLSVSAYLRAQAVSPAAGEHDHEAPAIFDQMINDLTARLDAANASLEATLARLNTKP